VYSNPLSHPIQDNRTWEEEEKELAPVLELTKPKGPALEEEINLAKGNVDYQDQDDADAALVVEDFKKPISTFFLIFNLIFNLILSKLKYCDIL